MYSKYILYRIVKMPFYKPYRVYDIQERVHVEDVFMAPNGHFYRAVGTNIESIADQTRYQSEIASGKLDAKRNMIYEQDLVEYVKLP